MSALGREKRHRASTPPMKTKTDSTPIIGLDLGDRRHTVCVLDHAGETIAETTIPNTREHLDALSRQLPGAEFALTVRTGAAVGVAEPDVLVVGVEDALVADGGVLT